MQPSSKQLGKLRIRHISPRQGKELIYLQHHCRRRKLMQPLNLTALHKARCHNNNLHFIVVVGSTAKNSFPCALEQDMQLCILRIRRVRTQRDSTLSHRTFAYDSNWQQQQNKLIRNVYSGQRQSAHQATKQASQPGSHVGICLIICKVAGNIKEYLHQSIQD